MKYIIFIAVLLLVIPIVSAEEAPVITSVSPTSAYNVGVTVITINGNHFSPGCEVYLVKCGGGMIVGTISSHSYTSITAAFNIKNIAPGEATVKVYNSNTLFTSAPLAFTILGDTVVPTPTPSITSTTNTISPIVYYTATPSQTSEPEPEETITYIYNIPTPTEIVPLDRRGIARTTSEIPSQVQVAETTVKPPTPQIVKVKPTKSPLNITIVVISLLCIIMIIRRKQ